MQVFQFSRNSDFVVYHYFGARSFDIAKNIFRPACLMDLVHEIEILSSLLYGWVNFILHFFFRV